MKNFSLNKLFRYFISGLIFVIPIYLAYKVVKLISSFTSSVTPTIPLSFMLSLVLLTLIGFFITKVFNTNFRKKIKARSESPTIVGRIFYLILNYKETSEKTKKAFSNPILYKVDTGIYKIGFITSEEDSVLESLTGESEIDPDANSVWVYAPYPLNFMGEFLLVEKTNIKKLDKKKEELIPFILTAGIFKK